MRLAGQIAEPTSLTSVGASNAGWGAAMLGCSDPSHVPLEKAGHATTKLRNSDPIMDEDKIVL